MPKKVDNDDKPQLFKLLQVLAEGISKRIGKSAELVTAVPGLTVYRSMGNKGNFRASSPQCAPAPIRLASYIPNASVSG